MRALSHSQTLRPGGALALRTGLDLVYACPVALLPTGKDGGKQKPLKAAKKEVSGPESGVPIFRLGLLNLVTHCPAQLALQHVGSAGQQPSLQGNACPHPNLHSLLHGSLHMHPAFPSSDTTLAPLAPPHVQAKEYDEEVNRLVCLCLCSKAKATKLPAKAGRAHQGQALPRVSEVLDCCLTAREKHITTFIL